MSVENEWTTVVSLQIEACNSIKTYISQFTILYCSSSNNAWSENRSNIDVLRPSDLATLFFTIGWSCLWSPISTTCFALDETIGIRVSGSRHMPHSSTMHWNTLLHASFILWLPAAEHVQRTIWTYFPLCELLIAHFSAAFINWNWTKILKFDLNFLHQWAAQLKNNAKLE